MSLNILALGASQNIGYITALYLLSEGNKVTFLLRRKDTFDADEKIQSYIKSGHIKLSFGDATSKDDVKKAWVTAEENGPIDFATFSVGGKPSFSITKGVYMENPHLVSQCTHALLSIWPRPTPEQPISPTKLIAITSHGITPKSHAALPGPNKLLHNVLLPVPHQDKRGVEFFLSQVSVKPSDTAYGYAVSEEEVASLTKSGHIYPTWKEGLYLGEWIETLIIRPSLLTGSNDKSKCEEKGADAVRAGPEDMSKCWAVGRKDVAWFIAKRGIKEWDSWKGKAVTVSY